jgi:hypothetical protein
MAAKWQRGADSEKQRPLRRKGKTTVAKTKRQKQKGKDGGGKG